MKTLCLLISFLLCLCFVCSAAELDEYVENSNNIPSNAPSVPKSIPLPNNNFSSDNNNSMKCKDGTFVDITVNADGSWYVENLQTGYGGASGGRERAMLAAKRLCK